MDKPKEFWISPADMCYDEIVCETEAHTLNFPENSFVHVIEYSAYEQLKAENEKAYDALAGNICGYCWQKMEDEPTAKRSHQDHVNELLAEITALKSKLEIAKKGLEFYADGEGDVLDWSGVNNSAYIQVKGKRAKQALLEIGDTE